MPQYRNDYIILDPDPPFPRDLHRDKESSLAARFPDQVAYHLPQHGDRLFFRSPASIKKFYAYAIFGTFLDFQIVILGSLQGNPVVGCGLVFFIHFYNSFLTVRGGMASK